MNTYTLAQRDAIADVFSPINGIPCNMNKLQAERLAIKARNNGFDVVAFNLEAE